MQLTPESFSGNAPVEPPRPGKPKKEPRPRRAGDEEPVEMETMDSPPEGGGQEPCDGEGAPKGRGMGYKVKMFFLCLAVMVGFVLFVINAKGFIDSMRIDNVDYSTESQDSNRTDSKEDAGTDVENIPDAQEGTEGTQDGTPDAQEDTDGTQEDTDGAQDAIQEGTENRAQAESPGSISKQEADELRKEAQDAKNAAATMEQELTNTKALLEASQAREAQLRQAQESMDKPDGGK